MLREPYFYDVHNGKGVPKKQMKFGRLREFCSVNLMEIWTRGSINL